MFPLQEDDPRVDYQDQYPQLQGRKHTLQTLK